MIARSERLTLLGQEAFGLAADWLLERHEDDAEKATKSGFFRDQDQVHAYLGLPRNTQEAIDLNAAEWLVAEGTFEWMSDVQPATDALSLVLGPGGPNLEPEQRRWLELLKDQPIGLYRVREVQPAMIWLDDVWQDRPPLQLWDAIAVAHLEPGDVFGARLLPWEDVWLKSSAVYMVHPNEVEDLQGELSELREQFETNDIDTETGRWILGGFLEQDWLGRLCQLDDLILGYSSIFLVKDWDRLARAIAREKDVKGNRTIGWTQFTADVDEFWLLALNPRADDLLELFSCDEGVVEAAEQWLARLAGRAVTFADHKIVCIPKVEAVDYDSLPKDQRNTMAKQFFKKLYQDWEQQPLPDLMGKPPILAIKSPEGRSEVAQLLLAYETSEREDAKIERRKPVSLNFLWKRLGLDRGAEFTLAEPKGEIVEIVLPWGEDKKATAGFPSLADVESIADYAMESWRAEQDQQSLPPQLRHRTLLKGIPAIWLESTCVALGIEPRALRYRKDREQAIAQFLSDADQLRHVVCEKLSAPERELLTYVQEKGGQVAVGLITRRFGRDDGDGWFWNEQPPTSVLGRVRLHGLAFVGRLAVSGRSVRSVAIPHEIRDALAAVLRDEAD